MAKRILIIGAGYMGRKHIRAYLKNTDARIVGIVVKSDESAKKIFSELGISTFTNIDDAICKTNPEFASICTPTNTHLSMARQCIEQGLDVLIEKPLAETGMDASELNVLAEKKGRRMVCAHTELFTPAMTSFFNILKKQDRLIRQVLLDKSGRDISEKYPTQESMPAHRTIFDALIHQIYISNAILPGIPQEISARMAFSGKGIVSSFKIDRVSMNISLNLNYNELLRNQIRVIFDDGELIYSLENGDEKIFLDGQEEKIDYSGKDRFENMVDFFLSGEKKREYFGSGQNAVETIIICEKIIDKLGEDESKNSKKIAYLQVTRKCNNDCVFCSNPKFEEDHSLEYIKRIINEYKQDGISELFITGGEPTVHKDIFEIILAIKDAGIIPRMITNGMKLSDRDFFKRIMSSGLDSVHISVHTHLDMLSEKMHGRADCVSHQKMALQLNEEIESKTKMHVNTTINNLNYKYLPDFASFMISNYPKIKHIVFNFLDPGTPDGILRSNAARNSWVVARYFLAESYINSALTRLAKSGISFRIERVPLCYLNNFEIYSTETRKMVKNEKYRISFLRSKDDSEKREVFSSELRVKADVCIYCNFNSICAGVQKEYSDIYGFGELYPLFRDKDMIRSRILDLRLD